jgi:hypothetical protein
MIHLFSDKDAIGILQPETDNIRRSETLAGNTAGAVLALKQDNKDKKNRHMVTPKLISTKIRFIRII